jgi:hypothetical protein
LTISGLWAEDSPPRLPAALIMTAPVLFTVFQDQGRVFRYRALPTIFSFQVWIGIDVESRATGRYSDR